MKIIKCLVKYLAIHAGLLCCCAGAWAQESKPEPPPLPSLTPEWTAVFARDQPHLTQAQRAVAQEVMQFRVELARALRSRDIDKLKDYYAPNFTMTHGSGYVDDRAGRIGWGTGAKFQGTEERYASLASIRVHGENTAVAVDVIPYATPRARGHLRVMTIYRRVDQDGYRGWQQAAFQVNNLAESVAPVAPAGPSAPGADPIPPQR